MKAFFKTTSGDSVTTVRDFGPHYLKKWQNKHWLIGKYVNGKPEYFIYATPNDMKEWISTKVEYVKIDFKIAKMLPSKIKLKDMQDILGTKKIYTLTDAKKLQKKQYTIQKYKKMMDLENGYSPNKMLEILKDRATYVLKRGSTLNNPHIPFSYIKNFPRITENHAQKLCELVKTNF